MTLNLNIKVPPAWNRQPEILLCPQIPKPMHGVAPRIVMGAAWWDGVRIDAYRSTSYHCLACGVYRKNTYRIARLEGHEVYNIDYLLGRMEYVKTVPLCTTCHNFIHLGRLEMLRRKGEITDEEYQRVITHGTSILKKAKLKKSPVYNGVIADWSDWRLILGDKEFPPAFKNEREWAEHFGVL